MFRVKMDVAGEGFREVGPIENGHGRRALRRSATPAAQGGYMRTGADTR
jgi:hypothetical protein